MTEIKYYGLDSHFNGNATFNKDVNINGNLNYDSLTTRNLTVKEQSNLAITTITSLSTQNLNVSGVATAFGGFISVANTTPITISLSGNRVMLSAVGIGSTSFILA